MRQGKGRRYAVGAAAWALCIMLCAIMSVGVSAAEEFETDSAARVGVETKASEVPQLTRMTQIRIDATMASLRRLESVAGFDPVRLSAAGRNLFSLADRWPTVRERLINGSEAPAAPMEPAQSRAPGAALMLPIRATNVRNSRYSGFTQSETSTAWCGNNLVTGFNDTGAEVTTMASGRGLSNDGYAFSSNRGATFTYIGSPSTPSDPNTFMSGDPVVTCANAATFYYVSSFLDGTKQISGVSLSISTDGGKTFALPAVIAGRPSNRYIVGGAWIAVDRSTPGRLYVAYTDLDFSGSVCGIESGSAVPRYAIETVSWDDGGTTCTAT